MLFNVIYSNNIIHIGNRFSFLINVLIQIVIVSYKELQILKLIN